MIAILLAAYAFCTPGYAHAHRPPYAYTHAIKLGLLHGRPARLFELDHRIPIELGGNPYARSNLQLQRWPEAHAKDADENALHDLVCAGQMPLAEAQKRMWEWKP
jgi:hypothetical protein